MKCRNFSWQWETLPVIFPVQRHFANNMGKIPIVPKKQGKTVLSHSGFCRSASQDFFPEAASEKRTHKPSPKSIFCRWSYRLITKTEAWPKNRYPVIFSEPEKTEEGRDMQVKPFYERKQPDTRISEKMVSGGQLYQSRMPGLWPVFDRNGKRQDPVLPFARAQKTPPPFGKRGKREVSVFPPFSPSG